MSQELNNVAELQKVIRAVIDRVLWTAGATSQNRGLLAEAIAKALRLQPAAQQAGWVSVPAEPTEERLRAGVRAFQSGFKDDDSLADWRAAYRAFVAPSAPAEACKHHFVMDEEAVLHSCCQKCGLVRAPAEAAKGGE